MKTSGTGPDSRRQHGAIGINVFMVDRYERELRTFVTWQPKGFFKVYVVCERAHDESTTG